MIAHVGEKHLGRHGSLPGVLGVAVMELSFKLRF